MIGSDDLVAGQNGALTHLDEQRCFAGDGSHATIDLNVVELTCRVERFNGVLDVVNVECRACREACGRPNRGGINSRTSRYDYGFGRRARSWGGLLRMQRSRAGTEKRQRI